MTTGGAALVFIDRFSSNGHGHRVICHEAGGDSDMRAHTSNRADEPCNEQIWTLNGGHEGV